MPDEIVVDVVTVETDDGAKLTGALYTPHGSGVGIGIVVLHPVVDFLRHYLARPLAGAGFEVLCLNSRYARFEHAVLMERLLLDVAAGVQLLRDRGCRATAVLGNSGGGSLMAFYQRQAEAPSPLITPCGTPVELNLERMPAADAVVELNAHRGRHHFLTMHLDPSVVDEDDPWSLDRELDMFNPANGPPYDRAWLSEYREAQLARNRRITARAEGIVEALDRRAISVRLGQGDLEGQQVGFERLDELMLIPRTMADPRSLDLSIEPSDRSPGTVWGPAEALNTSVTAMARVVSARSWLSQYSWDRSNADGPRNLAHVRVPVLVLIGSADRGCYPSDAAAYYKSAGSDNKQLVTIPGGSHFMSDQPQLVNEVAEQIGTWLRETVG